MEMEQLEVLQTLVASWTSLHRADFFAWSDYAFSTWEAKGHAFSWGGYTSQSKVEQEIKDKWTVLNEISVKQR